MQVRILESIYDCQVLGPLGKRPKPPIAGRFYPLFWLWPWRVFLSGNCGFCREFKGLSALDLKVCESTRGAAIFCKGLHRV